jgi:hypothetical protein
MVKKIDKEIYASSPPLTFVFVFYVQKEQYKKDIGSSFVVELCSLCLRTRARCHSLKNPTPKHTSQNNAHNLQPTMARTDNESNLSPGRGGDDDRRDSDDNGRGGNNDRRGGNDGRRGDDRRKSKRHTSPSTGTQAKKKTKGTTAETPTDPKQNDGNVDNATSQGGATDEKAAEEGVSAENNGNASDNNVEVEEINNNPVRKPGFSYLEKQVLQAITNIPPFFAVTRALNLKTITPCHQAVLKKRRSVLLK